MANNCYNYLSFEGTEENVNKVLDLFKALLEEQRLSGEGVLPKGYDDRYFFDISLDSGYVMFWTKWSPPTDALSKLAQEYQLTITNDVEELGWMIYGKETYYADGGILEQYLEEEDFDLIGYDEDGDVVTFKGEPTEIESEAELLEKLLSEKFN